MLETFKKALFLEGIAFKFYVENLHNPEGKPVDRSNIYHAVNRGSPKWLRKKIERIIDQSYEVHSEWWANHEANPTKN